MGGILNQAHDIGDHNGAFGGNDKGNIGHVLVFRAIGVEVIIQQDWNFTRHDACIGSLFRHDWIIGGQFLEILDTGTKIVQAAPHRAINGNGARITNKSGCRIQVTNHAFVFRLQKVSPRLGYRLAFQRRHIHEKTQRTGMNGKPAAFWIFQAFWNFIEMGGLIGVYDTLFGRLDAKGHTIIGDVCDRIVLFRQKLRQGLTGILIVMGNVITQIFFNHRQLRCPIGPLRGAVIANGVFSLRCG